MAFKNCVKSAQSWRVRDDSASLLPGGSVDGAPSLPTRSV
jgi:hypothetical protein